MDSKGIILAAHRGDRKNCPENTMPAFIASLKAGVEMIETDIHLTKDGELVIMHDRSALRTAGVDRNLDEMTLAEIKEFFGGMVQLTGTLWEHDNVHSGSLNHGFASYVAAAIRQALGK